MALTLRSSTITNGRPFRSFSEATKPGKRVAAFELLSELELSLAHFSFRTAVYIPLSFRQRTGKFQLSRPVEGANIKNIVLHPRMNRALKLAPTYSSSLSAYESEIE